MNILFWGPFPYRAPDNESLMLRFQEEGHRVFFLNQYDSREIEDIVSPAGIVCARLKGPFETRMEMVKQMFELRTFIRRHRIDVVFSHLDPGNIVSVLTQFLVKARFIIVRHYVDEMHLLGQHRKWAYKMINALAKEFVVVSARARAFMIQQENISSARITVIPLLYDFSLFPQPSPDFVAELKNKYKGKFVLLTACRMVKDKRPELAIEVVKHLSASEKDICLILLGQGELENDVRQAIVADGLEQYCHFIGFQRNVMDYLELADVVLHPSILDSSSVLIKEAGLRRKVAVVCRSVGDCDEYIESDINGYIVDKDDFVNGAVSVCLALMKDGDKRKMIGNELAKTIQERFDIDSNFHKYISLLR